MGVMVPLKILIENHFQDIVVIYKEFKVVPVPLHPTRLKERGFDQAYIVAREVARFLNIVLEEGVLIRIKKTSTQTEMNQKERLDNVKNAFEVMMPEKVSGQNVLLVDDVFTTGATLNEATRVLKKAGALTIHVFTLARA